MPGALLSSGFGMDQPETALSSWGAQSSRKDGGQEEKGMTEGEMVGWHHQLNGHESEQIPGDSEGQGSLACCSPRGHKESDTLSD